MNNHIDLKKIILSVTNDLSYDQRVHKVALMLQNIGFEVLLVGRKRKKSAVLTQRPYKTKRLNLLFEKGLLFYLEYNFRLFLFLMFQKSSILVSNDLDTLLANYLVSQFRNFRLVYDSHELFTEIPELQDRQFVKKVWLTLEKWILPKLKYCSTVSQPIGDYYQNKYKTNFIVIRNLPLLKSLQINKPITDPRVILYQGSVNKDRGVDLMIKALPHLEEVEFWIVGEGDELQKMKTLAKQLQVENKVSFFGGIPFEKLDEITSKADLGISFESSESLNYQFALPNKIFDYINVGVPVLATPLSEVKEIIEKHDVGKILTGFSPEEIAKAINEIFANQTQLNIWRENTNVARKELCWERESVNLIELYNKVNNA